MNSTYSEEEIERVAEEILRKEKQTDDDIEAEEEIDPELEILANRRANELREERKSETSLS